jgi:GNAT superfamily N-acetyltransferase
MDMVTIRQIRDFTKVQQELLVLQKACLPHDEPVFPDNGVWWIGRQGEQNTCFALIQPSYQWMDTAYLARAGVLEAWRGQGLQRRLIRVREAWAKKAGYRWMISDTTDNVPSSNNLMRCGYKLIEPSAPWANNMSLYWTKRLRHD